MIFPSICSRILDCVINNLIVAHRPHRDCGFANILERQSVGKNPERYKDSSNGIIAELLSAMERVLPML
jgi:hypothetical protein